MGKDKGFSLVELLIVVAIILIVAAIAIPNLIQARISANEASAAASVRTIANAETTYSTAYPLVGYTDLASLGGPAPNCVPSSVTACIVDSTLTTGSKSGYNFTAAGSGGVPAILYTADAQPQNGPITGVKEFCAVDDNVVRFVTPADKKGSTHAGCLGYAPIGN